MLRSNISHTIVDHFSIVATRSRHASGKVHDFGRFVPDEEQERLVGVERLGRHTSRQEDGSGSSCFGACLAHLDESFVHHIVHGGFAGRNHPLQIGQLGREQGLDAQAYQSLLLIVKHCDDESEVK